MTASLHAQCYPDKGVVSQLLKHATLLCSVHVFLQAAHFTRQALSQPPVFFFSVTYLSKSKTKVTSPWGSGAFFVTIFALQGRAPLSGLILVSWQG